MEHVEEIRFEMRGHLVVAWLPATESAVDRHVHIPNAPSRWFIEIDGMPAIPGPLYARVPKGREDEVEALIRDYLKHELLEGEEP